MTEQVFGLAWTTTGYRLYTGQGDDFAAAHATLISGPSEPEVWRVFCAGPGDTVLADLDCPSADEAKAAVAAHIAANSGLRWSR